MRVDNKMKAIIVGVFILGIIIGKTTSPETKTIYRNHNEITYLRTDTIPSRIDVMSENNIPPKDLARQIRNSGSKIAQRTIVHLYQKNGKIIKKEISN